MSYPLNTVRIEIGAAHSKEDGCLNVIPYSMFSALNITSPSIVAPNVAFPFGHILLSRGYEWKI
jgi:hypothetical protein